MDIQNSSNKSDQTLIDDLLRNTIDIAGLERLRTSITPFDLSLIIQKIYDLNDSQINSIAALSGVMAFVDQLKNSQRSKRFFKKIDADFRKKGSGKVILAEGDSWFNYPIILSDVLDWIGMDENLAVYSLASGGDWLLNMLNGRKYVEQLSVMHPDVFLISGGGNDLVGSHRLAAVIEANNNAYPYEHNPWAKKLISDADQRPIPILKRNATKFDKGVAYLSKDFFALLMFFHLQYYSLIDGILTGRTGDPTKGKFPGIKIITQGYDYPIPSHDKGWGKRPTFWYKPFIRTFLGHGKWLKEPMQMRGITDPKIQENIAYAMIYLFNEMMIYTGGLFTHLTGDDLQVCHVDSRKSVGEDGWTDELHPLPSRFKMVGETFIKCINNEVSPHGRLYVVSKNH